MASTALVMVAAALVRITCDCGSRTLISRNTLRPSTSDRPTSTIAPSGLTVASRASAAEAFVSLTTFMPSSAAKRSTRSTTDGSSSTTSRIGTLPGDEWSNAAISGGDLPCYRPRQDVLQEVEAANLEIVHKRRREVSPKELAELVVRRMAQIALQPVEIVEIDEREKIGRVGHASLVPRSVFDADADADASHLGNRPDRALEDRDELLALVGREVKTRLQQDDVRNHGQNLAQPRNQ